MTDRQTVTNAPNNIPVSVAMPQPGDILGGRFLLERCLGLGGAGVVFQARDATINQQVAIKVLHSSFVDEKVRERVRREVRAARPGHPNAVTIFELYEENGLIFLAMEMIDGPSLAETLKEKDKLTVSEVVKLGSELASALKHFATRGLVHRDVKPGNVLLGRDGIAKLCDTGLVRSTTSGETVTESAMVLGTPSYMAPEQAAGIDLGPKADIYALGLTLYKCLAGEVPLVKNSAMATAMIRSRTRAPGVRKHRSDCPRWLDHLILWMLEPKPVDRPTADQVVHAFESKRLPPRVTRRALKALISIVILAATAWAGYTFFLGRTTERVEVFGNMIRGVDDRNETTWFEPLYGEIHEVERADLTGDGRDEIIVETRASRASSLRGKGNTGSEIIIVDRDGKLLTRVAPKDLSRDWQHPFTKDFDASFDIEDLDHDGFGEVVLNCFHPTYYPAAIMVYWPRLAMWEQVLDHSGKIFEITYSREESMTKIGFLAVNNILAYAQVYGEIALGAGKMEGQPMYSPPLQASVELGDFNSRWSWSRYVLFNPDKQECESPDPTSLEIDPTMSVHFPCRGGYGFAVDLDAFGNPTPGPNEGLDLQSLRIDFLNRLSGLKHPNQPYTLNGINSMHMDITTATKTLLREPLYRALLSLFTARAHARAGNTENAVAALLPFAETQYDVLVLQLAHFEAIDGELESASRRLRALIDYPRTPKATFDAPILLINIATENRNSDDIKKCVAYLASREHDPEFRSSLSQALLMRSQLWWNDFDESNLHFEPHPYVPAAEALAQIGSWRLKKSWTADIEDIAVVSENNPDAVAESLLGIAAVHLGNGQANESLMVLDKVEAMLDTVAREDFSSRQLLDLTLAMRVQALHATGRIDEASKLTSEYSRRFTPGLLPSILIEEIKTR